MSTSSLLRIAPLALLLAMGTTQARTHVAPHVFEARSSGCAKGQHIPKATLTRAAAADTRTETCDDSNTRPAADDARLRESPSLPSSSKKEFKGHVTVLK